MREVGMSFCLRAIICHWSICLCVILSSCNSCHS